MFIPAKIIIKQINQDEFIAVNSLTGAVDILDSKLGQILAAGNAEEIKNLEQEMTAKLLDKGYLYHDQEGYTRFYNQLNHDVNEGFLPLETSVYELKLAQNNDLMPVEAITAYFHAYDRINENKKPAAGSKEVFQVRFDKAIPADYNPQLSYILEKFREAGKLFQITLFPGHLKAMLPIITAYHPQFSLVQVSIASPGDIPAITPFVNDILACNALFNIKVVLNETNSGLMEELVHTAREKEWDNNIYFTVVFSRERDAEHYDYLLSESGYLKKLNKIFKMDNSKINTYNVRDLKLLTFLKSIFEGNTFPVSTYPMFHYCDAVRGLFKGFAPDGFIYPCYRSYGKRELAIGRFFPEFKIDKEAAALWENRKTFNMKKCRECEIELLCGGGCPLSCFAANQNIHDNPLCSAYKKVIHDYIDNLIADGNL